MTIYDYCVLQCDACETPLGWSSDQSHPSQGITICNACWAFPQSLPRHLRNTLGAEQAFRAMERLTVAVEADK